MSEQTFQWSGYTVSFLPLDRVYGYCDWETAQITIDSETEGKALLDTMIHEGLHALDPDMSENKAGMMAKQLAELLWTFGYRDQE